MKNSTYNANPLGVLGGSASSSNNPPGMMDFTTVFHAARQEMIIFGGFGRDSCTCVFAFPFVVSPLIVCCIACL